MRHLFPFLISVLVSTAVMAGADSLIERAPECGCRPGVTDPFEEPLRFGFGPYKGQCVNSCKFRRPIFVTGKEAPSYGADPDHLIVANILHEGRYWIARVPLRHSSEVDVGFERFFYAVSHLVLRFRFPVEAPVELFVPGEFVLRRKVPARKIYDLVLSAEAVPPKDHPFGLMESSLGHYLLDYRLLSIEETYRWMVEEKGHTVKQFRMTLTSPEREKLLHAALNESTDKSFKSAYALLTNNCATSLFAFIDRELSYAPSGKDWLGLVPVQSGIPMDSFFGTLYGLGARRLVDGQSQLRNLEDELRALGSGARF